MTSKVTLLFLCVCASTGFAGAVGGGGGTPPQGAIFNSTTLNFVGGTNGFSPVPGSSSLSPISDGFSFSGLASFSAAPVGGLETITMEATEQFTAGGGGYAISIWSGAYLWSDDIDTSAVLTSYSAVSTLLENGDTASELLLPDEPIPYSPNGSGSIYVTGSATSTVTLPAGSSTYTLEQLVTLQFSGLASGEVISVDFPSNSTVDPTPEPGTLLLAGSVSLGIVFLRRRVSR